MRRRGTGRGASEDLFAILERGEVARLFEDEFERLMSGAAELPSATDGALPADGEIPPLVPTPIESARSITHV